MKLGRISQSPREHFHNAIAWNFCFHPTIKNLEIDTSVVGVEENPSYPSYSRNCSQIYLSIKRDKLFDFNGKKLFPYALALVFLSKHHLAILLLHFRIIFVNPPKFNLLQRAAFFKKLRKQIGNVKENVGTSDVTKSPTVQYE